MMTYVAHLLSCPLLFAMMNTNLLAISPFGERFYDVAFVNLFNALSRVDPSVIEIEFKYAIMTPIKSPPSVRALRDLPADIRNLIEDAQRQRTHAYLTSLETLSCQNIMYLNPIGRQHFYIASGFNEHKNRKFYHMRDMLQKTTEENKRHNYRPRRLGPGLNSIYHEISQNNENYLLKMTDDNELRMDLYIREHAPPALQGRYSYCSSSGWTKTNKELCNHQMDFLMSENYYRMAVNKEIEEKPHPKLLTQLAAYCKVTTRPFDIRLKRSMRVLKEDVYEISLSEIYTITNSLDVCQAVGELIFHPINLENYMRKKFINFYTFAEGYSERVAWEIELELQKAINFTLKELVLANRIVEVRRIVESSISQLYSLFFADHATKVKEMGWLNRNMEQGASKEGRLDNEFGTYMRQHLYREMTNSKPQ